MPGIDIIFDCGAKRPKVRLHLRVDHSRGCIESVDLIEMKALQEAMVLRHAARERPREVPPVTPSPADRRGRPV
jgi:hypothetical protein